MARSSYFATIARRTRDAGPGPVLVPARLPMRGWEGAWPAEFPAEAAPRPMDRVAPMRRYEAPSPAAMAPKVPNDVQDSVTEEQASAPEDAIRVTPNLGTRSQTPNETRRPARTSPGATDETRASTPDAPVPENPGPATISASPLRLGRGPRPRQRDGIPLDVGLEALRAPSPTGLARNALPGMIAAPPSPASVEVPAAPTAGEQPTAAASPPDAGGLHSRQPPSVPEDGEAPSQLRGDSDPRGEALVPRGTLRSLPLAAGSRTVDEPVPAVAARAGVRDASAFMAAMPPASAPAQLERTPASPGPPKRAPMAPGAPAGRSIVPDAAQPVIAQALHAALAWVNPPSAATRKDPLRTSSRNRIPAPPRPEMLEADPTGAPTAGVPPDRPAPYPETSRSPRPAEPRTIQIGTIEVRVQPPLADIAPPAQPARPASPAPASNLARGFTTPLGLRQG
jgi:hypothetical protein